MYSSLPDCLKNVFSLSALRPYFFASAVDGLPVNVGQNASMYFGRSAAL